MEKEALNLRAAAFFAAYPKDDVVYITADGQAFAQKNKRFGDEHAKAKFDGVLQKVTRQELAEVTTEANQKPARSKEDQDVIDELVENLKRLGLTEAVAKKLRVSGLEDVSSLTEKQKAEYDTIVAKKEEQSKTT